MMKRLVEHDEIDQFLSGEEEILPSSGFATSVMDAVRREAAVPPPIPFPWKRALPGLVVGAVAFALALSGWAILLARAGAAPASSEVSIISNSLPSALSPLQQALEVATAWTVASLLAAFVTVKLSMRLSFGRA
jgi:hypothetical protein